MSEINYSETGWFLEISFPGCVVWVSNLYYSNQICSYDHFSKSISVTSSTSSDTVSAVKDKHSYHLSFKFPAGKLCRLK